MTYDWQAGLVVLAIVVIPSMVGKYLAFRIPALQRMREYNREHDEKKLALAKYPPIVKANVQVGMAMNFAFFIVILPLVTTLQSTPAWQVLLQIAAIVLIYDFAYYMTHRFLFHGQGYFRQIHALHHQARHPTHIDGSYVHPLETFIGIGLFMSSVLVLVPFVGELHAVVAGVTYLAFFQFNSIAHTYVNLPYFPFKTLTRFTQKHAVHHENMHKGNYSTVTLLFDRLFGTLQ